MAKSKPAEKGGEKDGGEKPVEKPVVTPPKEKAEIVSVTPAPQGRVETKLDSLGGAVDEIGKGLKKLTEEIFGSSEETPAQETRSVQAPEIPPIEAQPDSGKAPGKDSGDKRGYPRLDFFK